MNIHPSHSRKDLIEICEVFNIEIEDLYDQPKISLSNLLEQEIENFNVADRIKRLQGKGQSEKPLEYWTEKEEQAKQKKEKERLLKQYVTTPPVTQKKVSGNKLKTFLGVFLVLAFFVGTAFGAVLLKPADTSGISMAVNDSAFPVVKNNTTNTTLNAPTSSDSTVKTTTTKRVAKGSQGGEKSSKTEEVGKTSEPR